jgi:beta-lactamase superfamily II metal-dependent hydrolase
MALARGERRALLLRAEGPDFCLGGDVRKCAGPGAMLAVCWTRSAWSAPLWTHRSRRRSRLVLQPSCATCIGATSFTDKGGGMSKSELKWELLTKKRGSSTQGIPAGKEHLAWVTNTVTLIHGERDAVLVDTFLSAQHSRELLDWVVQSGKNLVTIYVTHAHGDHFFGLKVLLDRFPNAKAVATAPVVAGIQNQIKPDFMKSVWEPRFPGQLPSQLIAPEVLDGDTFYLEGEAL